MMPAERSAVDGPYGLKPQVQRLQLTLSMITVPPILTWGTAPTCTAGATARLCERPPLEPQAASRITTSTDETREAQKGLRVTGNMARDGRMLYSSSRSQHGPQVWIR